jgi:hypothetical protein
MPRECSTLVGTLRTRQFVGDNLSPPENNDNHVLFVEASGRLFSNDTRTQNA